jgi:hypothetical protein
VLVTPKFFALNGYSYLLIPYPMNCPVCDSVCRVKLSGYVCLDDSCGWYTGKESLSGKEISLSPIAGKLREQQIDEDFSHMGYPYDGI